MMKAFLIIGVALVVLAILVPAFDCFPFIKKAIEKHGEQGVVRRTQIIGGCLMIIGLILSIVEIYQPYDAEKAKQKQMDAAVERYLEEEKEEVNIIDYFKK